jgi:DNA replication licensing factor MCM5
MIITDRSKFVDQQQLKLQEAPESVPTGEMPRHILLTVERQLSDKIAPGTRVAVFGVVTTFTSSGGAGAKRGGAAVKTSYLRVVGIMIQEEGTGRAVTTFTPEEDEQLRSLSRAPNFYNRMAASVAPSISGDYTADIKKAILCLLMAGSRKLLPDGMRLRGDINVLMLGDPSTAKSQFLKVSLSVRGLLLGEAIPCAYALPCSLWRRLLRWACTQVERAPQPLA